MKSDTKSDEWDGRRFWSTPGLTSSVSLNIALGVAQLRQAPALGFINKSL